MVCINIKWYVRSQNGMFIHNIMVCIRNKMVCPTYKNDMYTYKMVCMDEWYGCLVPMFSFCGLLVNILDK